MSKIFRDSDLIGVLGRQGSPLRELDAIGNTIQMVSPSEAVTLVGSGGYLGAGTRVRIRYVRKTPERIQAEREARKAREMLLAAAATWPSRDQSLSHSYEYYGK